MILIDSIEICHQQSTKNMRPDFLTEALCQEFEFSRTETIDTAFEKKHRTFRHRMYNDSFEKSFLTHVETGTSAAGMDREKKN